MPASACGQIQTLGFSLYMEMLDRAVKTLQKGEMIDLDDPLPRGTEVNLHFPAIIPDDYIPDVHTRLVCYKAIANCRTTTELDDSRYSMVDRFGPIPPPLLRLYAVTAVKLTAEGLGIELPEVADRRARLFAKTGAFKDTFDALERDGAPRSAKAQP